MGEGGGIFFGGAQLADQRILLGGHQQLRQVARGRYVVNRQARRLNVASMGHAQRLGLDVHGANKGVIAARIMVGQTRGSAVFGGHQRQQQHIAAADLAVQPHA